MSSDTFAHILLLTVIVGMFAIIITALCVSPTETQCKCGDACPCVVKKEKQ